MSPRLKPLRRGRRPPTKFGSGRGVADTARMGEETQQEITGAWTSLKKDYNMIVIPAYLYEADAHYLCLHDFRFPNIDPERRLKRVAWRRQNKYGSPWNSTGKNIYLCAHRDCGDFSLLHE
nr:uncharacterized protein LOC113808074 [Penaeus vannamei]